MSRSRSRNSAYDLVKIENRSHKRSHKVEGIGVGIIRPFSFLSIPLTTPSLMIQWKLDCRSRKQKRKTQQISRSGIERCDWFILELLLSTSLERERHMKNRCSAPVSVGLFFTRSYRSTLLIMSLTATPSLEKPALKEKGLLRMEKIKANYKRRTWKF